MSRSFILLSSLITIFVYTGCSLSSPTFTDINLSTQYVSYDTHNLWGLWDVSIDSDQLKADILPVRSVQAHWNITGFIEPPQCSGCLTISNIHPVSQDVLSLDVKITHPFPGYPQFDGYDVKGIVLGLPVKSFPVGSVSDLIDNPDGYTTLHSYKPWADINPFINFAVDTPERRFENGKSHSRTILFKTNGQPQIKFSYAIDSCWIPPKLFDPDVPSLSRHCNEAYKIDIDKYGTINPLPDSNVRLDIKIHDWQNDANNSTVLFYIPAFSDTPYKGYLIKDSNPPAFRVIITNISGISAGFYTGLLAVSDQVNNPINNFLTNFQLIQIHVTNDIPSLTGIQIDSSSYSLFNKNDMLSLILYGIYSDGGFIEVKSEINWASAGVDLKGNTLCSIDKSGIVTRLTSKYFGGIAEITAFHSGFESKVNIYCVDSFADKATVQFGALNEPGGTFTKPENLLGPPQGSGDGSGGLNVCSLGYGGIATLEFTNNVIIDGDGPDVIVFENGFYFANCQWNGDTQFSAWNETAVVEASQDGVNWKRFPFGYNPSNTTCNDTPYVNPSSFYGVAGNRITKTSVDDNGKNNGIEPTDPLDAGGDRFDLKDVNLKWCKFIRIIDTGHPTYKPDSLIYDSEGDVIDDFGKHSALGPIPGSAGFDGDSVTAVFSVSPEFLETLK